MLTFDTVKFEVPPHTVKGVNMDIFRQNIGTNMDTGLSDVVFNSRSEKLPAGVSQVKFQEGGSFTVTLSAKTLRQDYLSGINLNTWERAFNTLDPVINIDRNAFWDANPKILSCDTTDNIPLELIGATKKDILNALMASKKNTRFETKQYDTKRKLGVEFHGDQEDHKNRMICYDKVKDLLKKANKGFIKSVPNPSLLMKDAESSIRFETNHTTFESIRNRFKITENNFQKVLQSTAPVNHDFLLKIINGRQGQQYTLFEEYKEFKGTSDEFITLKGIESICSEFDNDEKRVKQFFKTLYGDNFNYHYYKKKGNLKKILSMLNAKKVGVDYGDSISICHRILSSLLKAVA